MQILTDRHDARLVSHLKNGGIAVIRTDTLYGLVARADDESAVERVYAAKHRDPNKGCIVLVADAWMLYDPAPVADEPVISTMWPGPVSVVLASPSAPKWLQRAGNTIAYRCPADAELRTLLARTGPLIAPSANPEGLPPASTIDEAIAYFGDTVDVYVDGGTVPADTPPSQLITIHENGTTERLR